MKIYVKLFASLAKNVPQAVLDHYPEGIRAGTRLEVELPRGSTLDDLVNHLALPREQVKVTFVNGRGRELDYLLAHENEVSIFPPIGGG